MPKLRIFALCEKVIIDKEDRTSLITLFNTVAVQILPNAPEISSNAVAPKEWCLFTLWETPADDIDKEYCEVAQLSYPNGEPFGPPMKGSFIPRAGKTYSHVLFSGNAFPIGQQGSYTVRMHLEHADSIIFESEPIMIHVVHNKLQSAPPGIISFP